MQVSGLEIYGLVAAVFMGLTLGVMGGGGAILTVPILVYFFNINPVLASAYSLFIVGCTALVGGTRYFLKGEVELKTGLIFATPGFLGVYLSRAVIVPMLPDPVLKLGAFVVSKPILIMSAFSVIMLLAASSMIRPKKNAQTKTGTSEGSKLIMILIQGLGVGLIAGFVGAGGGFLIIPALVVLVGLPMRKAVGTSLMIISVNSLFGFIGDLQRQALIDWKLLILVSSLSLVGMLVGVSVSHKINEASLKKAFGFFVLLMGAVILVDQIRKL